MVTTYVMIIGTLTFDASSCGCKGLEINSGGKTSVSAPLFSVSLPALKGEELVDIACKGFSACEVEERGRVVVLPADGRSSCMGRGGSGGLVLSFR